MPELPEVETIREGLARHILGGDVTAVEFFHPRATRRSPGGTPQLRSLLLGSTVAAVARRGKYLWLELEDRPAALVIHLGMSGQLLVDPRKLLCQSVGLRFCFNFGSEQSAYRDIQNLRQLY